MQRRRNELQFQFLFGGEGSDLFDKYISDTPERVAEEPIPQGDNRVGKMYGWTSSSEDEMEDVRKALSLAKRSKV